MKFGVVCDVEGKTYLDNGATVEYGGMRYIFYVKDINERLLTKVRIISDVDDADKYSYHKSEVAPDGTYTVTQNYEPHIYEKLIKEMQNLESLMGILGNVKKIFWNKAIFEYYPETEAEFKRINILPAFFFLHELTVDDAREVPIQMIAPYLRRMRTLDGLAAPMAFFRESKNEYSIGRYINSFFNSYFVIEGLFGNGKWRKEAIVRELTQSSIFSAFVESYLDEVSKNNDPREGMTKAQLLKELQKVNQPFTSEGLLTLIVETRGRLHHFSIKSTQAQGTPLNNFDYKRIALIAFKLAGDALSHYLGEKLAEPEPPEK
jgi:hypothetical protein